MQHKVFNILLIILLVFAISCKKRFERGYVFEEPGVKIYEPAKEYSVEGKIIDYNDALYDDEIPVGLLRVITEDNQEYLVQLAPIWFLRMEKMEIKTGDKVRITGCPVGIKEMLPPQVKVPEDEQKELITLLARKVEVMQRDLNKVLILREKNGDPKWYGKGRFIGKQKYIQQMIQDNKLEPPIGDK